MAKQSEAQRLRLLLHRHYGGYDNYIRHVVPKYDEIQDAVLRAIPFADNDRFDVLELGLGTGETTIRMLSKFKRCRIDAIDYSDEMIQISARRLKNYSSKFTVFNQDFIRFLPKEKYDLIISTLAIHHVRDKDKRLILKKVYNKLKYNGVFINGDMVMFNDEYLNQESEEIYTDFLRAHLTYGEYLLFKKRVSADDFPTNLEKHIEDMKRIGFRDVAIIWRYYGFAVYKGNK